MNAIHPNAVQIREREITKPIPEILTIKLDKEDETLKTMKIMRIITQCLSDIVTNLNSPHLYELLQKGLNPVELIDLREDFEDKMNGKYRTKSPRLKENLSIQEISQRFKELLLKNLTPVLSQSEQNKLLSFFSTFSEKPLFLEFLKGYCLGDNKNNKYSPGGGMIFVINTENNEILCEPVVFLGPGGSFEALNSALYGMKVIYSPPPKGEEAKTTCPKIASKIANELKIAVNSGN